MPSLDDVLSDKPVREEKPAAEAPAEPKIEPLAEPAPPAAADGQPTRHNVKREHQKKEWAAQGRDPETGQFLSKQTEAPKEPEKKAEAPPKLAEPAAKPAAPPAQEMTEKERAAFAAAADERRKRQELERRLAALEQTQQPKSTEPAKTFWDDPDGALKAEEQKRNAVVINTKLQTSEMIARSRYTDFDEKIATFKTLVEANPGLVQQWIASPDPAAYAYDLAKNHQELQQLGGLAEMRKKIEEETTARVRKEVEAEHAAKIADLEKQRAALPPSLSDVRGATSGKTPAWTGPTSLDGILGKPH